jgi:hypothetical protein
MAGLRRAALLAAVAASVVTAAPARAATVLVGDVARAGAQAAAADRGACDHPLSADEAAGTVASACAWPAHAGDWGPPLLVQTGETLEVTLDAPASAVRATVVTTGTAAARAVLGPADLTPAGPDARAWQLALTGVTADDLAAGSLGLALLVDGEAFTITLSRPPDPVVRPPAPPPLAFGSATLQRDRRAVVVTLKTTIELPVTVVLARGGRRLAMRGRTIRPGDARLRIPLGPRARRTLRAGMHVDVTIHFGATSPLRARGVPLRRG